MRKAMVTKVLSVAALAWEVWLGRLSVRLPGSDNYAQDAHNELFRVWEKEDSIVAEASAEHTLPLIALECPHVSLEGIGLHLVKRASDALLNRLWQVAEIPLCVIREITNPAHV
jgi:hypothetical protein